MRLAEKFSSIQDCSGDGAFYHAYMALTFFLLLLVGLLCAVWRCCKSVKGKTKPSSDTNTTSASPQTPFWSKT